MEQVRKTLDPEEPNYVEGAKLGTEAIPHLETLVRAAEPMLASKAAYLASMILSEGSERVVQAAAQSPEAIVRVAAAAAARNLATGATERVLATLNRDHDEGVRKVAARALDDEDVAAASVKSPKPRRGKAAAEASAPGEGGGSVDGTDVAAMNVDRSRQASGPVGEGGGSFGETADPARGVSSDGLSGSGGGSLPGQSQSSLGDGGGDHSASSSGHAHDHASSGYRSMSSTDRPNLFGGGQF